MKNFVYNYEGKNIIGIGNEDTISSIIPKGTAYYFYTEEDVKLLNAPPETWILSGTPDGYGTEEIGETK